LNAAAILVDDPHFCVHLCNSCFFEFFGSVMLSIKMQSLSGLSREVLSGVTFILTDIMQL